MPMGLSLETYQTQGSTASVLLGCRNAVMSAAKSIHPRIAYNFALSWKDMLFEVLHTLLQIE